MLGCILGAPPLRRAPDILLILAKSQASYISFAHTIAMGVDGFNAWICLANEGAFV